MHDKVLQDGRSLKDREVASVRVDDSRDSSTIDRNGQNIRDPP